jgi:DnaD/phage-associated family protein
MRKVLPEFRERGRLAVYICYLLHANERNRSWPSAKLIAAETGFASESVAAAKAWLVEHGALESVPYDKREGAAELNLHQRQDVMQITGVITIDGITHHTLYFNISPSEISPTKISPSEIEDITNIEGIDIIEDTPKPPRGGNGDRPKIFAVYEQNIGILTPMIADDLNDWLDTVPESWIEAAIKIASQANKRSMRYVSGILRRCNNEGRPPEASRQNDGDGDEALPDFSKGRVRA